MELAMKLLMSTHENPEVPAVSEPLDLVSIFFYAQLVIDANASLTVPKQLVTVACVF